METKGKVIIPVAKLNEFLGCKICNRYFRDAHTLTECLHTFCKECLLDEFEKAPYGKKQCPICDISLGRLLLSIILLNYFILYSLAQKISMFGTHI